MDREDILSQCCTSKCSWNSGACHVINEEYSELTIEDFKFLSTLHIHTLSLSDVFLGEHGIKYITNNQTLHTLCLRGGYGMSYADARYLSQNKTLHTLILSFNMCEYGVKYFEKSIIPNLIIGYPNISKISKDNYTEYIDNIKNIVSKYIIKDITNIIMDYIKND